MNTLTGLTRPISSEPGETAPLPDDPEEILRRILDADTRGDTYSLYRRLREVAPVHRTEVPGLPPGTFALTSYTAVNQVARAPGAVNDPRTAAVFDHDGSRGPFYQMMGNSMLFLEKPAHDRIRRSVFRSFTPRAVAPLGPLTESVANTLLDRVEEDGEMDYVESFSYPLPIRAICQLLGVPPEEQEQVEAWAWDFARAGDPMTKTAELAERGDRAADAFYDLFDRMLAERRQRPGDDIMSKLATPGEDGDQLSNDEAISTCVLLLQAGHETTADLLGNALVGLFRHPDQHEWLRNNQDSTKEAVEEFLRYDCSVQMSMRLITEDLEVEGVEIPSGSLAALFYGAANRDPSQFTDPDRLDLQRQPMHLAFSAGTYHCVGNALARTELTAALRVLMQRHPDIAPKHDTFLRRRSLRLRGPQELLVRWS